MGKKRPRPKTPRPAPIAGPPARRAAKKKTRAAPHDDSDGGPLAFVAEHPSPFEQFTGPQRAFLAAYSVLGRVQPACAAARLNYWAPYNWIKRDPEFRQALKLAKRMSNEALEDEARRRAMDGVMVYVFYKGKPVLDPETLKPYREYQYSDRLMELLLKANKPKKYRERIDTTHRHSIETPGQGESLIEFLREQGKLKNESQAVPLVESEAQP